LASTKTLETSKDHQQAQRACKEVTANRQGREHIKTSC